jgi:hypothetical protein
LLTGQTVVADIARNDPGREAEDCFIHCSVFPNTYGSLVSLRPGTAILQKWALPPAKMPGTFDPWNNLTGLPPPDGHRRYSENPAGIHRRACHSLG